MHRFKFKTGLRNNWIYRYENLLVKCIINKLMHLHIVFE